MNNTTRLPFVMALTAGLLLGSVSARAQQTPAVPVASGAPPTTGETMGHDGYRAMGGMTASRMPQLKEKGVVTVVGNENWKVRTGFGKNNGMVAMMTGMMVEGTGLDKMKMDVMKMDFSAKNFTEDEEDLAEVATSLPVVAVPVKTTSAAIPSEKVLGKTQVAEAHVAPPPAPPPSTNAPPLPDSKAQGVETLPAVKPPAVTPTPAAPILKITARVVGTARVGDNKVVFTILDGSGQPVLGAKVTAAVAMTSMDMGTTRPTVKEIGKGAYATTANFSMIGPWRVLVKVSLPNAKPQVKPVDITVK